MSGQPVIPISAVCPRPRGEDPTTAFPGSLRPRRAIVSMSSRHHSNLGHFAAHTPSLCLQRKGAILAIPEQTLAHARFELATAVFRKRNDIRAARAGTSRERIPIVVERCVRLVDHEGFFFDVDESSFLPELAQ